jgi:hypothetical protein
MIAPNFGYAAADMADCYGFWWKGSFSPEVVLGGTAPQSCGKYFF